MFLGMGPFELIIVVVVVLLIFGPKNLPKLGSALGKTVKSVREGLDSAEEEATKKKSASSAAKEKDAEDVVVDEEKSDKDNE